MEETDPWEWSVEHVVLFFRHYAARYCQDKGNFRLPNLDSFEQALIENEISGADLLNNVNFDTLRSHLGVKALGQANSVLWCIQKLNAQSTRVRGRALNQQRTGLLAPIEPGQQYFLEARPPDTPLSTTQAFQTPHTHNLPLQVFNPQATPLHIITSEAELQQPVPERAKEPTTLVNGAGLLSSLTEAPKLPSISSEGTRAVASTEDHTTPDQATSKVRAKEIQIQDGQGRKRRKLDLSQSQNFNSFNSTKTSLNRAFYSSSGIPVDAIFYGSTELGKEIQDLELRTEDGDQELALTNFSFHSEPQPIGDSQFVASRLRFFFLHSEQNALGFQRGGRAACAIYPYQGNATKYVKTQSATVIQFLDDSDEPLAFRENAAFLQSAEYLESGDQYHDMPQDNPLDGQLDYLLQKYMHRTGSPDLVVSEPMADNSHEDDSSEQSGDEMAEEEPEGGLTKEYVSAMVDQAVVDFATDWVEKCLPRQDEKHASKTWRLMKQSRTIRQALIEGANRTIEKLRSRIASLKEHFLLDVWHSERAVADVCESLRPTVDEIELQKWKINVWQRKEDPVHVTHPSHHTGKVGHAAPTARQQRQMIIPTEDRFKILSISKEPDVVEDDRSNTVAEQTPARQVSNDQNADDQTDFIMSDDDEDTSSLDEQVAGDNANSPIVTNGDGEEDDLITPTTHQRVDFSGSADDMEVDKSLEEAQTSDGPANGIIAPSLPPDNDSDCEILDDVSQFFVQQTPGAHGSAIKIKDEILSATKNVDQNPASIARGGAKILDPRTRDDSSGSPPLLLTPRRRKLQAPLSGSPALSQKDRNDLYQGDAVLATADQVEAWNIDELVKGTDRMRVLIKLLSRLTPELRAELGEYIRSLHPGADHFFTRLSLASHDSNTISVHEVPMVFARLAWAWHRCSVDGQIPSLSEARGAFTPEQMRTILRVFTAIVEKTRLYKGSKQVVRKVAQEVIDISSDSDQPVSSPRKVRKRETKLRAGTEIAQKKAQDRAAKHKNLMQQVQDTSPMNSQDADHSTDNTLEKIMVNIAREDDEDPIFIPQGITQRIKKHQIEGVRFMWRELTAGDGSEDDPNQGCMLAHTMGLGKTMQTICVLACLNYAALSDSPRISKQIPRSLKIRREERRQLRVLILCPPSLLQNWEREIQDWGPETFRSAWTVESRLSKHDNLRIMEDWHKRGGMLLVGYQMFTKLLGVRLRKDEGAPKRGAANIDAFEKFLLESPDVVVADEAHKLKNNKALISVAAARMKTPTRIALTGTPMSNDVPEIYALVSWVAPDYLGKSDEFAGYFTGPIKDGTYHDSTKAEVRKSMARLEVLRQRIEPKVSRMGIQVLKGSIPPKVEFVITLTLSNAQRTAYVKYIDAVWSGAKDKDINQVTLFSWLSVLTLLTNHPRILKNKLFDVIEQAKSVKAKLAKENRTVCDMPSEADEVSSKTNDGLLTPSGEIIAASELVNDATEARSLCALTRQTVEYITAGINNDLAPDLSAKMMLLLKIMELSKQHDEQVLIFSQSLLTLDYVSELLRISNYTSGRIDGKVEIARRDSIIKDFQDGGLDAMVISTRAGGVGLNIQRASRVVLMDAGFNPSHEEQAIGRAYRLGQTKPVFVYRMVIGGTFETNMYDKQLFKTTLTSRIVDKRNPVRNTSRRANQWLYAPKDVAREDLSAEIGKDPKVLDVILADVAEGPGSMICTLKTMETLQEEAQDEPLTEAERLEAQAESARFFAGQQYRAAVPAVPYASTQVPPSYNVRAFSSTQPANPRSMAPAHSSIHNHVTHNRTSSSPASRHAAIPAARPQVSDPRPFPSSQPHPQRIVRLNLANVNRGSNPGPTYGGPPSSTAPAPVPTHGLPLAPP
jgi:SNF2 family DNA or RNA helicase